MSDHTTVTFQEQRQVLCQTTPLPHSRSRDRSTGAETHSVPDDTTATFQEQAGSVPDDTIATFQEPRQVLCQMTPLPHSRSRDRFCARRHHCHIPGAETGSMPYHTAATFQEQRQRKDRWAFREEPGNITGCLTAWGNGKDRFASEEQCWFTTGDTCTRALMNQ